MRPQSFFVDNLSIIFVFNIYWPIPLIFHLSPFTSILISIVLPYPTTYISKESRCSADMACLTHA